MDHRPVTMLARLSPVLLALLLGPACQAPLIPVPEPVAVAGPDGLLALAGDPPVPRTVRLDGSRSYVAGSPGAALTFRWRVVRSTGSTLSGSPAEPALDVEIGAAGLHVFSLVVRHDGLASVADEVTIAAIAVAAGNSPPVSVVVLRPERALVGAEVEADGTASHDPDPDDLIASYAWTLIRPDGVEEAAGEERRMRFVVDAPGPWTVALAVADSHGAVATDTASLEVEDCAPTGDETCNGVDDDCDGLTDEGFDADADQVTSCGGDCDDADPQRWPGAPELCDGRDNDCDGEIDEELDVDGDGVTPCAGDCDDADPGRYPGRQETCDGVDQDCDGQTDEGFDEDGDGWTSCGGDCAPGDPRVHPGAPEECDDRDSDCDGEDAPDGDGDGWSRCEEDCDDDPLRHPGREEIPGNGIDEDCDGEDARLACPDTDGDGYCRLDATCDPEPAGCPAETDCDDDRAAVHPGVEEVCDLRDNDCDGLIDEDFDRDGDRFTSCRGDCNDEDAAICPACPERCNAEDDNCDGRTDEGC